MRTYADRKRMGHTLFLRRLSLCLLKRRKTDRICIDAQAIQEAKYVSYKPWLKTPALLKNAIAVKLQQMKVRGLLPFFDKLHCWNMPVHVQVGITNRCNLRCRMCRNQYLVSKGLGGDMDYREFCKLIDQLKGVSRVSLLGIGEPLLHPDLGRMIEYCASKDEYGWIVSTTTNGMLLNNEIGDMLIESGLHELRLSLDAADKKTLERVRLGSNFDTIVNNIKRFREKTDMIIALNCLIMKENIRSLVKIVDLADDLDIDAIQMLDVKPWTGTDLGQKNQTFEFIELKEKYQILQLVQEKARQKGIPLFISYEPFYKCLDPFFKPYVDFNGEMAPCCTWTDFSVGNVFEEGFKKVWNGEKIKHFRKLMLERKFPSFCLEHCRVRRRQQK